MKKLKKLKLEALNNMLSREQMKKIVGGDYNPLCGGYAASCTPNYPGTCCSGLGCSYSGFYDNYVCQ